MESESIESGRVGMNKQQEDFDDSITAEDQLLHQVCSQIWAKYDKNKNGILEQSEMQMFIKDTLGSFEQPMIDSQTFEMIFKAFDTDGSGAVTKDEMLPFVKASLEAAQQEMDEEYDDEEEEYDPEEQEEIKQILE